MAASGRVISAKTIYLGGKQYRVALLEEKESSILPEKQVIGDWSKQSDPYKSQLILGDFSGGPGLFIDSRGPGDPSPNRSFISGVQTRWKFWNIPPFPVSNTDDLGTANAAIISGLAASDVTAAGTFLMYAAFANVIYVHAVADESWTLSYTIASAPATVTDSYAGMLGANRILVYAHAEGYAYKVGAAAWADEVTIAGAGASTVNIKHLAFWDDKMWFLSNTGQLYYATTLGTETADALLALPAGSVTDLFVGPDAAGEPILYAATREGLYAHDFANTKWVKTGLQLPNHANNGIGCCTWRDSIYFPSNMGVYEFNPRAGTVRQMGLDRDDGLSTDMRGFIKKMVPALHEVLALVDASAATSGKTGIYGWDGQAWEAKYVENAHQWNADDMFVSSLVGSYRIWFAAGIGGGTPDRKVRYQVIPTERVHPSQITGFTFAAGVAYNRLITPWYTMGLDNVDKIGLRTTMDIDVSGAGPAITADLARDWDSTWYALAVASPAVTVGGRVIADLMPPVSIDADNQGIGLAFRAVRFQFTFSPASSQYPILRSFTLEYVPKLRLKRKWLAVVDLNEEFNGQSPKAQRDSLETALGSQTLTEFTYRDEAGFYVLVLQDKTNVMTGKDERGTMSLILVEP